MTAPSVGQIPTWIGTAGNEWSWQNPTGGGGSIPYNGLQIFVSAQVGNDANSGSYTDPLATMGAALTMAATATNPITINVIDGAVYTGNFVINNVYLSIIAPLAIFTAASGNIFTIADSGSQHLLKIGLIQATGTASALVTTGTSSTVFEGIIIGSCTTSTAGNIFMSGAQLAGNFNATSSGAIRYITDLRSGSDLGRTSGISPYSTPSSVYISKLTGSDTTGSGTVAKPFQTINAALTSLGGTPTSVTDLTILDNETYDEALDFTGINNVNLIGPNASIVYTGVSDAITTDSTLMTIDLFELSATGGGKSLNNTGIGSIHINETILGTGDVDNSSTGLISIIGDAILVNMPNTGGGTISYTCNIRTGTDGTGVAGQYPGSVLQATTIALPVTAFNYYSRWLDASQEFWFQTNSINGSIQSGTLNQDMGTIPLNLIAGTWRINVVMWPDNTNGGIVDFVFNGTTTSIDTFVGTQLIPLTWETTIATNGTYGFQIVNNGKNASSSGYNMYFGDGIIALSKVG